MPGRVLVVSDNDGGIHARFVDGLRRQLNRLAPHLALRVGTSAQVPGEIATWRPVLIITVGTQAALRVTTLDPAGAVINALVPEAFYAGLYAGAEVHFEHSAVYIDQPVQRTVDLVAVALPGRRHVAALLGPVSAHREQALQRAAARDGMVLSTATVNDAAELDAALGRLLQHNSVLLALPDPVVVNGRTAKQWILGAYLRHVALVGYSRAFVKAGALMAVYSTPQQVGATTAERVAALLRRRPLQLPLPVHPRYFDVSVNYELARALGLSLPTESVLKGRLAAREEAP